MGAPYSKIELAANTCSDARDRRSVRVMRQKPFETGYPRTAGASRFDCSTTNETAASMGTTLADKHMSASMKFCRDSSVLTAERTLTYIQRFQSLFVKLIGDQLAFARHKSFNHILNDGFVRLDQF